MYIYIYIYKTVDNVCGLIYILGLSLVISPNFLSSVANTHPGEYPLPPEREREFKKDSPHQQEQETSNSKDM